MPLPDGFVGGLLSTEQGLANLDATRLENQANTMRIQQLSNAQAVDAQTRAAMQAEAARQMAAESPLARGGVGSTPKSMSDSEIGQDQPATLGDAGSIQTDGPKLSDLHLKEYASELGFARAAAEGGNLTLNLNHKKAAEAALAKGTAAKAEERKEQADRWDKLNQVVTAVTDQDSLNAAVQAAKSNFPGVEDFLDQMRFPKRNGQYVYNDNTAKKLDFLRNMSLTEKDRAIRGEKADQLEQRRIEAESRDEARKANAQHQRTLELIAQENLEMRQDVKAERKEVKAAAAKTAATTEVQRTLNKDPIYANFSKYEVGLDQARNTVDVLNQPDGYKKLRPSDLRALGSTFTNMKEGFRARTGGKYDAQELNDFNGAFQKLDKYIESIGSGTAIFNEKTARDVANTVTELYDNVNKVVVVQSLKGQELAAQKKGDPEAILFKGDIQRLFNTGQARWVGADKMPVKNKADAKYLEIGRANQSKTYFEGSM